MQDQITDSYTIRMVYFQRYKLNTVTVRMVLFPEVTSIKCTYYSYMRSRSNLRANKFYSRFFCTVINNNIRRKG